MLNQPVADNTQEHYAAGFDAGYSKAKEDLAEALRDTAGTAGGKLRAITAWANTDPVQVNQ